MLIISGTQLICTVCHRSFVEKKLWLRHLHQEWHQKWARRGILGWGEGAWPCSLIVTGMMGVEPGRDDRLLKFLSSRDSEESGVIRVIDFVWWEERPQVAVIRFRTSEDVLTLSSSFKPGLHFKFGKRRHCHYREGSLKTGTQWMKLLVPVPEVDQAKEAKAQGGPGSPKQDPEVECGMGDGGPSGTLPAGSEEVKVDQVKMAQLPDRILQFLNEKGSGDTLTLAELLKEDHQKVIGAVKSLQSVGDIIEAEQLSRTKTELTKEGQSFVDKGSHEAIVFAAIPAGDEGIPHAELNKVAGPAAKIGISKAMQNGWVKITKDGAPKVVRLVESIEDGVKDKLKIIATGDASTVPAAALADLKKRKLLTQTPITYYNIKKGPNFTLKIEKLETELTPEMLASGDWKKKTFKPYNFQALGAPLNPGHLHPLLKVRAEFRSILLEMGFSEMPTNRYVESSFWNFDALYVPQKHPARDAQDTFFMSQPSKCASIPKDLMEKVKAAHTGQDYETLGYGPDWKEEEAYKNCMRTHTTAVSARMLHAIGSQPEFKPSKLFSIDRVFRNETLDATHLAEFFQVEGVVADYNINLGNLIGILKEFFSRLGLTKLRFKPAYNPYTEPSMEVFSYHEGLKKWVEVGNSGMFRPEMLLPLGIPKDVRVVAWGLSLERPTMIRYGIDNIRDLVGPRVDLQMVYNNPICRLDTNFDMGSDGSYLENPLLKSPKREPKPGEPVKSPTATSEQEDPVATTKASKNKKKKKKKKASENEEAKLDSTQTIQNLSPGDAGDDHAKCVDGKDRPVEQPEPHKSSNKTSQQELKLPSPSPSANSGEKRGVDISRDQIAAARLNVIKSHLQAISESATLASLSVSSSAQATATDVNVVDTSAAPAPPTKSSKKKKKSKVKSASQS